VSAPRLRARWLSALAGLAALGWVLASASIHLARWFWPGELMAGFAWQLGWCGLALAAALLRLRHRRAALALALAAVLHLAPVLRLYLPVEPGPHGPPLIVAACNLQWMNRDLEVLERWFRRLDADLWVVSEVSVEHLPMFERLADRWPHQLLSHTDEQLHPGSWATAILSRPAFESTRRIDIAPGPGGGSLGGSGIARDRWIRPALEVRLWLAGELVTVRGAHPMRPGRPHRLFERRRVLDTLAAQDWSGASLLAGDLNLPPASPVFGRLLERTGLVDSRRGFGRQPTWPVAPRLVPLVAIDHALASPALTVLDRRTEPIPGADHRAVVCTLAVRSAEAVPGRDAP
jgi:endonuclease/exonuclease/phosphatase (EEP) superfamily protein YafD